MALVPLNSDFETWAARFETLRAASTCPPISALDFATDEDCAYDTFMLWLASPRITKEDAAFLDHASVVFLRL